MKNPTFKIAAVAMMVAGAFATQTYAAGFQLSEQSAIQMGRAMAGAGVVGDDLSAVHYNPAGMTLLSGTRMQATGTWVAVNLDYEGDSGQSENGRLNPPASSRTRSTTASGPALASPSPTAWARNSARAGKAGSAAPSP